MVYLAGLTGAPGAASFRAVPSHAESPPPPKRASPVRKAVSASVKPASPQKPASRGKGRPAAAGKQASPKKQADTSQAKAPSAGPRQSPASTITVEPGYSVGFRNDGTGIFPDDCRPVTRWGEGRYAVVDPKARHKRWKLIEEKHENVVWKKPIATHCNGGMIVVKGQLFMMKEPWTGDLGPQLYCLDPENGAVLWQKDVNHLPVIPEAERGRVREELVKMRVRLPLSQKLQGRLNGLAAKRDEARKKSDSAAEAAARKELDAAIRKIEADHAGEFEIQERKKGGKTTFQLKAPKAVEEKAKVLGRNGYYWNCWVYNARSDAFVGTAFQTPVSDGKSLFVTTGHRDVFCYDLKGNVKWMKAFGEQGPCWGCYIPSPLLVGDVLITRTGGKGQYGSERVLSGLNRQTGEVVWNHEFKTSAYMDGTPAILRIPIQGTKDTLTAVLMAFGDLVRASDGKVLAGGIGWMAHCMSPIAVGDTAYFSNGQAGGGYHGGKRDVPNGSVMAVKFTAKSRDRVEKEILWTSNVRTSGSPLYHDGMIFFGQVVLRAETGDTLRNLGKERNRINVGHVMAKAGPYLYHLSQDGRCLVTTADREMKFIDANELDPRDRQGRGFWNQGAQPFFSGNRIFLRSYRNVYCIGDPNKRMRLSAEHM